MDLTSGRIARVIEVNAPSAGILRVYDTPAKREVLVVHDGQGP